MHTLYLLTGLWRHLGLWGHRSWTVPQLHASVNRHCRRMRLSKADSTCRWDGLQQFWTGCGKGAKLACFWQLEALRRQKHRQDDECTPFCRCWVQFEYSPYSWACLDDASSREVTLPCRTRVHNVPTAVPRLAPKKKMCLCHWVQFTD